jgi:hypothetical protein
MEESEPKQETKDNQKSQHARTEEFRVDGEQLLDKVRDLVRQGNIRRIIIKNKEGKSLLELPLTAGLAGATALAVFAPVLAAVGAIAALVTECSVVVERTV